MQINTRRKQTMRIKETKVYKFDELTDKAKEKAMENLYDLNVDYGWWDYMYEDAANVGLKLTSFDLDRNRHAKGEFTLSAAEVAANIIRDHGEQCETYKTAQAFLDEINSLTMPDDDSDEFSEWENKMLELEDEFLKSLLEDYSIMLQKEYEYQTSEEAIIETIRANEYEFTEDGKLA
jgi:hypothetical protein